MQTHDENLKAFQAAFNNRREVAGSWLLQISATKSGLIKINKTQSALHTNSTIRHWRVELLKYCILETKANSFIETRVAFVEKVSSKEHRGLVTL